MQDVEMKDALPQKEKSFFVIDTNVLLARLQFVRALLEAAEKADSSYFIVIPWAVTKELEKLAGKRGTAEATAFLYAAAAESSHLIGQQIGESGSLQIGKQFSPDDLILECCCLLLSQPQQRVVLLTNDANLALKAAMHAIESKLNWKGSVSELLSCLTLSIEPARLACQQGWNATAETYRCRLNGLLEAKLQAVLGKDCWLLAVQPAPPWSLALLLRLLRQHGHAIAFDCRKVALEDLRAWVQRNYVGEKSFSSSVPTGQVEAFFGCLEAICDLLEQR